MMQTSRKQTVSTKSGVAGAVKAINIAEKYSDLYFKPTGGGVPQGHCDKMTPVQMSQDLVGVNGDSSPGQSAKKTARKSLNNALKHDFSEDQVSKTQCNILSSELRQGSMGQLQVEPGCVNSCANSKKTTDYNHTTPADSEDNSAIGVTNATKLSAEMAIERSSANESKTSATLAGSDLVTTKQSNEPLKVRLLIKQNCMPTVVSSTVTTNAVKNIDVLSSKAQDPCSASGDGDGLEEDAAKSIKPMILKKTSKTSIESVVQTLNLKQSPATDSPANSNLFCKEDGPTETYPDPMSCAAIQSKITGNATKRLSTSSDGEILEPALKKFKVQLSEKIRSGEDDCHPVGTNVHTEKQNEACEKSLNGGNNYANCMDNDSKGINKVKIESTNNCYCQSESFHKDWMQYVERLISKERTTNAELVAKNEQYAKLKQRCEKMERNFKAWVEHSEKLQARVKRVVHHTAKFTQQRNEAVKCEVSTQTNLQSPPKPTPPSVPTPAPAPPTSAPSPSFLDVPFMSKHKPKLAPGIEPSFPVNSRKSPPAASLLQSPPVASVRKSSPAPSTLTPTPPLVYAPNATSTASVVEKTKATHLKQAKSAKTVPSAVIDLTDDADDKIAEVTQVTSSLKSNHKPTAQRPLLPNNSNIRISCAPPNNSIPTSLPTMVSSNGKPPMMHHMSSAGSGVRMLLPSNARPVNSTIGVMRNNGNPRLPNGVLAAPPSSVVHHHQTQSAQGAIPIYHSNMSWNNMQNRPYPPLPDENTPAPVPSMGKNTLPPPPAFTMGIKRSEFGAIVLSWRTDERLKSHAEVKCFELYACQALVGNTQTHKGWKRIGGNNSIAAMPLPMACTLTEFATGSTYYFAVRGLDVHGRYGPFSKPCCSADA